MIAGAVIAALLVLVAIGVGRKDDKPTLTPVQAACQMLDDGDTPDQAVRALKLIVDDDTARRSVDAAVAGGC